VAVPYLGLVLAQPQEKKILLACCIAGFCSLYLGLVVEEAYFL
jgi:hypothetical protein